MPPGSYADLATILGDGLEAGNGMAGRFSAGQLVGHVSRLSNKPTRSGRQRENHAAYQVQASSSP